MALVVPHFQFKIDAATRRFVIWMTIGTAFLATLAAVEYFTGGIF